MASYSEIKKRIKQNGISEEETKSEYQKIKEKIKSGNYSYDFGVDEDYITSFINDANSFLGSAEEDYKGIGWSNASSTYDSKYSSYSDLYKRGENIRVWLNANKGKLDENTYNSLSASLESISSGTKSMMDAFEGTKDYYSQWETEEDYNSAVKQQEDYEGMLKFNLDSGKEEIRLLKSDLNAINSVETQIRQIEAENQTLKLAKAKGSKDAIAKLEENEERIAVLKNALENANKKYGSKSNLDSLISSKNQYYTLAERAQTAVKLANDALKATDFKQYSQIGAAIKNPTPEEAEGRNGKEVGNIVTYSRDNALEIGMGEANGGGSSIGGRYIYSLMNDEEVNVYNYYLAKYGKAKAQEYLDTLEDTLQNRHGSAMFEQIEDNAFLEYTFGVVAGLDQFGSGMRSLFSNEDYIPQTATQYASGMVREDLDDTGFKLPDWMGGSSIGQVGYDLTTTTANMLPSILVSTIPYVGQVAGASLLGASAAGNAKAEMLRLGYSKEQANSYGLLVGASEATLQYLLGGISQLGGKASGNVIAKIVDKIDNGLAKAAITLGGKMASEGLEEALQSILEPYIKSAVTLEDFEGVDWSEVVYSGLLGIMTAGVLEGSGVVAGSVANKVAYNQQIKEHGQSIIDKGGIDSLHALALDMTGANQNKEGQKIANLAGKVTDKASAKNVGKLSVAMQDTITSQNKADIQTALVKKGLSAKDAKRVSEYLTGTSELTAEQKAEIESNENIKAVVEELVNNPKSAISERARNLIYARLGAYSKSSSTTTLSKTTESGDLKVKNDVDVTDRVSESGKTTRISTGEEITINKNNAIAKIKTVDGERIVYLNTDQGVVEASDVNYANESDALIYESFVDMNPAFANAVIKNYDGSVPVQTYIKGMREGIVIYGRHNFHAVGKDISKGSFFAELSEVDQNFALKLGRAYAKADAKKASAPLRKAMKNAEQRAASEESAPKKVKGGKVSFENGVKAKTMDQKRAVRLAKYLSSAIGIDIVFYDARTTSDPDGKGNNGYYNPTTNAIHLDLQNAHNDTKTIAFTLSHEVTHFIKKWSPEKFNTFANFLMEQYAEHGVDASTLLSNKMAELGTTDADLAYEEMICDACETMLLDSNAMVKLMQLRQTDLTLFEKLKMHILELLNNLREAYRRLGYESTTDEAKALLKMTDVLEKFHALFEEAAVDATQNFQADKTLNTESVSVTEDGTVRLQMKQYQQTGRATLLNYLREQYGNENANDLILTIDNIYDAMKEIKNDEALSVFSNWQDTEVELDENGHPIFTTSVKNGDYELNQDFSRVCKKRRQLDFVLNMLAEDPAFEASHLTKQDFVKINKAIKAHGFEIACALCFVDSKRFRQAEWADSFANTWNDILNAVVKDSSKLTPFNFATKNPNLSDDGIEIDTSKAVTYRKWSDGKEDVKNRRSYESFEQMLSKADDGKWLEGNTNVRTIATLIRDNPELRHTFRGADIIASKGFDTIQRLAPGIRGILDGWGGSSVPKPSSNDASYDSSIINMSGYNKTTAYAMGGVRMNSFSDFMAHMFFDYCQAFADLSAKELPSQAYTKELIYVRLFGRSGQKINMSGIAAIRDDALPTTASKGVTKAEAEANEKIEKMVAGLDVSRLLEHLNKDIHQLTEADVEQFLDMCDYVWADESINMKHATLLQTGILYDKLSESKVEECYELLKAGEIEQALKVAGEENVDAEYAKNCGTIVVGVSDAHIRKLLRDPTVRMVIPYHKSGLNPIIARELRISAYNDYTLSQTTGVKRKGAKASDKIGSTAIKDAYGLKDFEFYDWFGKTIDGKLYDGKATADKYLEWCEKGYYDEKVGDYVYYTTKGDGYILAKDFHKKASIVPKFDAFVGEENYYKVLEDFDCYNTITGEHSAQGAVDFLRNGLPSDYKDVLVGALKEEQKVHDDFKDHLDNKGLKEEVMDIVKARGYEPSIKKQAKALQRKDPTKLKETDLINLLQHSKSKLFTDGSYIPVRINTPQILIAFAKEHGHTLENIPLAMSVYKARQAVSSVEEWDGNPKDTPHNLKPQEVVDIIRAMDNPTYLVFQTKNDRFAEIVKFGKEKEKAYAVIDFYDVNKNAEIMNGYKGGKYNILVTIYPSEDAQALKDYLKDKRNKVMTGEEMKKKGLSQRGLGSYVPALLNESPFFEDIITQDKPVVKKQLKKYSDNDYLNAVNRGDMKTAQSMLDEAASDAGYIKLFYHGTGNGDFTRFSSSGKPIWITANKSYAEQYANSEKGTGYKEDQRVMPLYAKMENRLDITSVSTIQYAFDDYNHRNPSSDLKKLADVVGVDVSELAKIGRKNSATYLYEVINTADFAKLAIEQGYDSIKQNEYGNITFGVLDPSQLKSAYVVTYNKKNAVPLSERFNTGNNDIRYQKKKASAEEIKARQEAAVEEFGLTPYFYDAGYILPDGKMINLSGEKNKHFGMRGEDHRAIARVFDDAKGSEAMLRFMAEGNIRIMAESPGVDIGIDIEPTVSQYNTISRFIANSRSKRLFFVDLTDINGNVVGTLEYDGNISAQEVIYDIKDYFKTGNVRENIHYQKKKVSNRTLLANALETTAQNDIERNKLAQYKDKIELIESEQNKLTEIRAKIKELSFTTGKRDTEAIKKLQFEANQTASRINTYDRQLLNLESTTALKGVLEREKELVRKKTEEKGREKLQAVRERMVKTQRELLTRASESRKKGIESRNKTEMRRKIRNIVAELNQLLIHPTKDKHVGLGLQQATAEALSAVNMDTVRADSRLAKIKDEMSKTSNPDKIAELQRKYEHIEMQGFNIAEKLTSLNDAYRKIKESDNPLIANVYDQSIKDAIENLKDQIGDTSIMDMSLEQLEKVYDMYKMVLHTIRTANKTFKAKRKETIDTLGNRTMEEVEKVGGSKERRAKLIEGIKGFSWNALKPIYAMEFIGSETLTELYENVREGEDVWAVDISEAKDFFKAQAEKYGYEKWDKKKQYQFTAKRGKSFSLSVEQMMSLYAYSKRNQADLHLELGGFVFDEAIEVTEKKHHIPVKYTVNTATAHAISKDTLTEIISKLTPEQIAFVDAMQDYLSSTMGAKGNEVSRALYDIELFKEKHYFPLKSAKQFMFEQNEVAGEVKIKNSGFSKETVARANNPIILSDFIDVWANHVNDMSMYHAFVLPLEDFNRVFNYKTPTSDKYNTESVKMTIQNAYGSQPVSYIRQLLSDLNGGARTDSTTGIINKLTGLFKKSAVFASASVVIQQPSAVARALALMDAKYFVGKPTMTKHKETWAEVKKYAPVAIIKEMGYFDTGMGQSTIDWIKDEKTLKDKIDEVASKAPALADELSWCYIWKAVKREVMQTHKELNTNSEEFLKAVGERFTEVVTKTQVYDSVLSRSAMMRSKDTGMKMATAFMAEPTTSLNMLTNALVQGKRGNGKQARKAIGGVVASFILNSVLVSIVYAGRDDDEDKTYAEKYLSTLTEELIDSFNPLTLIPFVKDIVSIVQGYDVERSDMAVITDIINAWNNLDSDNRSAYRKVEDFAGAIASIFGLPVKNVMRDARAIYNTVNSFVNGEKTTGAGIGNAIKESVTGEEISDSQQLYEAIISGDSTQIDRVKSRFKDQKALDSAIRKALRENDPRIKKAAEARNNGDTAEYMRIAKEIIAEGYFSQDNIVAAINAEINALNKDESTTSSSASDKEKSIFKMDDYYAALDSGDQATAYAVKEDIISTAVANGKERDEAEKDFNSSFASHLRELYEEGELSDFDARDMLVSYGGKSSEEAQSKVQYWEFKQDYPDYDDLSEEAVKKYYEEVEPYGIGINVYYDYTKQRAKCKGADSNGDGKTDSGSVKSEVLQVINSLPISSAQKDALYYLNGWTASKLYEAPWH